NLRVIDGLPQQAAPVSKSTECRNSAVRHSGEYAFQRIRFVFKWMKYMELWPLSPCSMQWRLMRLA
ncbi:hypothetical protein, partial [Xanthomonas phaseoli]|uniref:hypothetical protein n=2 Tax=Xanthomonas phaseoli TaxID=1985254 RepID=UPI001ED96D09